jgi:hypothetical protein
MLWFHTVASARVRRRERVGRSVGSDVVFHAPMPRGTSLATRGCGSSSVAARNEPNATYTTPSATNAQCLQRRARASQWSSSALGHGGGLAVPCPRPEVRGHTLRPVERRHVERVHLSARSSQPANLCPAAARHARPASCRFRQRRRRPGPSRQLQRAGGQRGRPPAHWSSCSRSTRRKPHRRQGPRPRPARCRRRQAATR